MNTAAGWLLAFLGTPIAGVLFVAIEPSLESAIREILKHPALVDDAAIRAEAFMYPLLAVGFVILSWLYIVPLAWALRGMRQLVAAFTIAAPIWLAAAIFFHAPTLDAMTLITTLSLVAFVGLPVFASALTAGVAVRPNHSFKRTRLRRFA